MNQHVKPATKKGAASFYVVIFAALVFTVIVLSFIRLMISESIQNTANDLSESAYDSALAGVEDAKTALTQCLENNGYDINKCSSLFSNDCNSLSNHLYGGTANVGEGSEQGYSCVKLAKDLDNYKVNLSAERPTAVIPISADGSGNNTVTIGWYSSLNSQNNTKNTNTFSHYDEVNFLSANNPITPPVVSVGFVEQGNTHINTVILRPSSQSGTTAQQAYNNANAQNTTNTKALVHCNSNQDPACTVTITASRVIEYLVINLPYNETNTVGFVVKKSGGSSNKFSEQISVDSTGRANDYYRRVESRLQLADINFPYPDYVVSAFGANNDSALNKAFWVTQNCWTAKGGNANDCSNYGKA